MDVAFDTLKKQHVRAGSVTSARFPDRFLCPLCQTEVVHASGPCVSPYFRHRVGADHEACELYSGNFTRDIPLAQHEWEHLDAVLVAHFRSSSDDDHVSFAVRFRPSYAVDSVMFVSGSDETRYKIHQGAPQQYFRITSPCENYLIKARSQDGEFESHIVEGFGDTPAVFRDVERESVRLFSHRALRPGNHIAVSRHPVANQLDPSLDPRSRLTITGLHAVSIHIPDDPSLSLRENILEILGFEVASAIAQYAFLSPMTVSELATDCWEVPESENLAILIRPSMLLSGRPLRVLVQQRRSGHLSTDYLFLNDNREDFVLQAEVASGGPELYRIGLADPPQFVLEIRRSSEVIEPECARLLFKFRSKSKIGCSLSWASHELATVLIDVGLGTTVLESISKPQSVEISVSDRSGRNVVISQIGAERQLTNFFRLAKFPCFLSATGYPTLTLRRERARILQPLAPAHNGNVFARSLRGARLLDAFSRRRVSPYVIRSLIQ